MNHFACDYSPMTPLGALLGTRSENCMHCTTVLATGLQSLHPQSAHHCTIRSVSPLRHLPLCHIVYSLVFWVKDSILWLSGLVE